MTSGIIPVRPEVAKKRRQRYIDLNDNLSEWLLPFRLQKVCFSRKGLELVRQKADVAWAHDILRHTYGSYHLAQDNDASKTSLQMGHMRSDVLFNHYRNLVNPGEAEEFWNIKPLGFCYLHSAVR